MDKLYWFAMYQIKDHIYYAVVGLDDLRATTDEYREDIKNQCVLDYNFDVDRNFDPEDNYTQHIHANDVIIWYVTRLYLDTRIDMKFINCPSKMPIG